MSKTFTLTDAEFALLGAILGCDVNGIFDISTAIPDQEQRREFAKSYLHRYFPVPEAPIHRDYDHQYFRVGSIAHYLSQRMEESTSNV